MPRHTWLDRGTIPELLHPDEDPGLRRGSRILQTGEADYGEFVTTIPGQRPIVFQTALNFQVEAGVIPVPMVSSGQMVVDAIILSIPDGETESFWGYGSGITIDTGAVIPAGRPVFCGPDNVRELWELQRAVEMMAGLMAQANGLPPLTPYRAPRVAFDLSKYYVVSTGTQNISIMAFHIPEGQ